MALRTADGRDVADDEWRRIPGFTKYKINRTGDVLGARGWILNETYNKTTDTYAYSLRRDDGGSTSRTYQSLLDLAWTELAVEKRAKSVTHIKRGEWRDIPSFPKHQMHESGEVRYKAGRRRVYPIVDIKTGMKMYRLVNEWGTNNWTQGWLLGRTYPKLELKEAS